MKITEERMGQLLPQNITDSELSLATKKVLAAMLDWYKNSKAKETHVVTISNKVLCAIASVGGTSLQESLRELNDFNLVSRRIGTKLGDASEYTIHFKNLLKPLKRMTFEEMFSEELESLENPISTTLHNSTLHNITEHNSTLHNITEHNSTLHNIEEQNSEEEKRKENNSFFEQFKNKVDSKLVGENENELLEMKTKISRELMSKTMEIGQSTYRRCNCYLNTKYQEAMASIV